jgi:NTE family protein
MAVPSARTAFVFPGGRILGAIQVGTLKALGGAGCTADMVVGSSAGAINAAWFAGNPTSQGVAELEAIWCGVRRSDIFPIHPIGSLLGLFSRRGHLSTRQRWRG